MSLATWAYVWARPKKSVSRAVGDAAWGGFLGAGIGYTCFEVANTSPKPWLRSQFITNALCVVAFEALYAAVDFVKSKKTLEDEVAEKSK